MHGTISVTSLYQCYVAPQQFNVSCLLWGSQWWAWEGIFKGWFMTVASVHKQLFIILKWYPDRHKIDVLTSVGVYTLSNLGWPTHCLGQLHQTTIGVRIYFSTAYEPPKGLICQSTHGLLFNSLHSPHAGSLVHGENLETKLFCKTPDCWQAREIILLGEE